ncbi:C2-domain-containing protein [Mycena olivaceomarginata]|nr:C2-domain-containing protein [Mycena olivaceomarginata]
MSKMLESIGNAVHHVHDNAHDLAAVTKSVAEEKLLDIPYVDLTIQFIGASGIPKVDVVGSADPYFVAKLDNRISFVSTVKVNTLKPNVPVHASLAVEVLDKDDGAKRDDYIGKFSCSVSEGAKECEIDGPIFRRAGGTFWLKSYPYMFDGPIRFSRHFPNSLLGDTVQQWNHGYKAAQSIFAPGPSSLAVRSGIMAGHRLLYARSTTNSFGVIEKGADVLGVLRGGVRVKPAVYTYIISAEDDSLRFSETGAAFFVDFASKHALHANCHPCRGWAAFDDATPDEEVKWEIVVDNNSGTYSPDKTLLPKLKALLDREACRAYALNHRGVKKEDLQPQRHQDQEETLADRVSQISKEELQNVET